MQVSTDPRKNIIWLHNLKDQVVINYEIMGRLKSKGNKSILFSTKLDHP